MLILELILAVVLPPLGILVHKGKASKWFWITLLLCILSGVLWRVMAYIGGAACSWLLAVILALLYVFGTIKD